MAADDSNLHKSVTKHLDLKVEREKDRVKWENNLQPWC
jgi:hypothetical protein